MKCTTANYPWELEGRKLTLKHPVYQPFWMLPEGCEMPSRSLLSLAEFILLRPYGERLEIFPSQRRSSKVAVAFSGGYDSAACLRLLPDPLPIHTNVSRPKFSHRVENALLATREVGGIVVDTDYDDVSAAFNRRPPFLGAGIFSIPSILLADHFSIGTIAEGQIIDFIYLRGPDGHGSLFLPKNLNETVNAFRVAGLEYCLPCAGMSEVLTSRIATDFKYAMGCMNGSGGKPCHRCMKCFRKEALFGNPLPSSPEVNRILEGSPIPVLGTLLWASRHRGLRHPRLDNIQKDISWVDKWYPDSLRYIPEELRDHFCRRLKDYAIEPLEDPRSLLEWNAYVPKRRLWWVKVWRRKIKSWLKKAGLKR